MPYPLRPREFWAERVFLWHAVEKFRLKPLVARLASKSPLGAPFSLPPAIVLQLTEACNLRCRMCYEWGETGQQHRSGTAPPATLPFDVVETLMRDCRREKTFYSLFGGEPLLHPDLERVIQTAKRFGSSIETVTNGTRVAGRARALVEGGLDLIRVSLDGPRDINDSQRGPGTYDRVLQGLEALYREKQRARRANPIAGIICTVTPQNCLSLERLFRGDLDLRWVDVVTLQMQSFLTEEMGRAYDVVLARSFGKQGGTHWKGLVRDPESFSGMDVKEMLRQVRNVRDTLRSHGILVLRFPNTWEEKNLDAYRRAAWRDMADFKGHCVASWVVADVTARGDVAPCHIFYDLTVGNLGRQSIAEIWNGPEMHRFRKHMKTRLLPVCPACCQFYGYP
jgi:radical SAM protein with 4Fe4S-binding SPASM domain